MNYLEVCNAVEALAEENAGMELSKNLRKYLTRNSFKRRAIIDFLQELKREVDKLPNDRVVDLGCGEGFVLRCLFGEDSRGVVGVDKSQRALDFAKALNPNARFLKKDVLDYDEGSVDLVLCTEVLEHLLWPGRLLEKVAGYAGSAIFTVPDKWRYRLGNVVQLKNLKHLGNDVEHESEWTGREFKAFLKDYFDEVSVKSIGWFWLVAVCTGRRQGTWRG